MKIAAKVVYNHFPQIRAGLVDAGTVVRKTAFDIQADIREQMEGPKSGRIYTRSGGKTHQASAPGEAPAIDYGALAGSVQVENTGPMSSAVYSNMDYAVYLEFSTRKMAARPAWIPAANRAWGPFLQAITNIAEGK